MKLDNKKSTLLFSGIVLITIIFINLIARNWFFRIDLTDNKMYSLSQSSVSVVEKIDDPLTIKIYFSNDLPGQYGNNKRYLQDLLEEYSAYSSGDLKFEFYSPESDEQLAEDAQKYGIQPVQLQVIENDAVAIKKVYMGLVILYEDNRETIPVIQTSTGLEYDITTKIKNLVETNKAKIGILSANSEIANQNLLQSLNQRFNVQSNLNLSNKIPDDIKILIINGLEDSLSVTEEVNLRDFITQGGNIFIGQNRVSVNIQTQQAEAIQSNIFDILDTYGLSIEENLVLDNNCGQVNVQQQMGIFRMAVPMDYPFIPIINKFNTSDVTVAGLESMTLMFTSEIKADTLLGDNFTPLLFTSNQTSSMSSFYNLSPDPKNNPAFSNLNEPSKILGARTMIGNESNLNSIITLIADSKIFADQGGGSSKENMIFIMNTIDFMLGDSELISLRSREVTNRPLLTENEGVNNRVKLTWKIINMILPTLMIIALGVFILRRKQQQSNQLQSIYE
tara:strand:- start:427 stop:1944 length:1518 start_codon:yes stop_codon:yes gene_type:complete